MRWDKKLQEIIDYVEHHLQRKQEPIKAEEIERIAACSFSFFQKVFSYTTGVGFAEYLRFRKMTLAGYDLKSTDMKVIDLSYKYGYDSPTAFTRAFQQFHGMSPKEAREPGAQLSIFPKMHRFTEQKYSWEIQYKPAFRLIGRSIDLSNSEGQVHVKVPEFWSKCQRDGTFSRLISMDTATTKGMIGLFDNQEDDLKGGTYSIMVISDCEPPEGFTEKVIPESAWAVFDCRGSVPSAIQRGWKYLQEEWIVKYPFKHADCPELEWYSDENSFAEDYLSQIWIPIIEDH